MAEKVQKGIEKAIEYARKNGEYYEYYAGSAITAQLAGELVKIVNSIHVDGFEINYRVGPHARGFYWSELEIKKVA